MKRNNTRIMTLVLVLMLTLCVAVLAACNPPPPVECTHDWVAGDFTVKPVCGEVSEGTRTYTCSLCGETKEETVTNTATECTWDEGVVTKAPTCTEKGELTMTCSVCTNTQTSEIADLGGHVLDIYAPDMVIDEEANKRYIPCAHEGCTYTIEKEAYVTYEMYGAVGDGETDDFDEIKATHAYANEWGIEVRATKNAKYYIGYSTTAAVIQTNVNWGTARFIIDDTTIRWNDTNARNSQIFKVTSKTPAEKVVYSKSLQLSKGQTNIGLTFDEPVMLRIENGEDLFYIRGGKENPNNGIARQEMILVDAQGNVDPSTPIQYDYAKVTSIVAYSITDAPLTISGGRFETRTCDPKTNDPNYVNNYCYFYRGLEVSRSNTTLTGMVYAIKGEHASETNEYDNRGVPYNGTFTFRNAYNVTFSDSKLQTHKTYSFFQDGGSVRNEMGTYTLLGERCIGVNFINLKQTNALTDRVWSHGIMGSNFCRNFYVEDCELDRFDAHQGLHNATIKNTTLGFGCLIIGGGTLTLENVTRLTGSEFINLRSDYNSVFDGDIYMKDCTAGDSIYNLVGGNWLDSYNGLPNVSVRNLHIDGLTLKRNGMVRVFNISGATPDSLTHPENPFILPTSVTYKNVKGGTLVLASQTRVYESVPFTKED